MAIDGARGPLRGHSYTPLPQAPQPHRGGGSHGAAHASPLAARGVPGGPAPQQRVRLPSTAAPGRSPWAGGAGPLPQSRPSAATALARQVGRELAAFVPDKVLGAFSFSAHLLNRPPLGQVLQHAASHTSHFTALSEQVGAARGNGPQLQAASPQVQASFQDVRQTWRALRQTPVSQLLANREAVKHQLPQLQAAVEKAYQETAQAYPPTHPAWKEAAKAKLSTDLSTLHVYARMAAVNVLGLRSMVAGSAR